ncbi:hypothetical protein AtubIFM57258_003782 [Aspergillus tubingensis]|nr:hypothetical protein AtubIFM57258_003782 [Aspergillus tubingensis]
MVMAVMAEVTPVESIGPVTGLMSTIFALSSILGPVLGGAITTNASWRWVFYLKAAFLAGFPFMVLIVYLPERFEIQDGLSPVASGIRMLPLLLLSALGAGAGGVINSRKNISFYTLMVGLSLQLIGLGCMTTLPTTGTIIDAQYGYQVLLGLGFGTTLTSLVVISRLEVDAPDLAITMGAVTQVRVLGGTIGISIGQVLITHFVDRDLSDVLSTDEMAALKASVSSSRNFPASKQNAVSEVYGRAFNAQIKVVLYITAACWVLGLGTFKKNPVNFRDAGRIEPCGSGDQEQDQG